VNAVGVGDDAALGRLAEDLGQPHHGNQAAFNEIPQDHSRPDRGELIHIPHQQKAGMVGHGAQ